MNETNVTPLVQPREFTDPNIGESLKWRQDFKAATIASTF